MPDSFGARLRQQREAREIDLVAISEQTKIKLALLEGLEHDDVSHWPSGIFRRAYIRTYAQFIGLDPDASLREFLEVHADPGDVIVASAADAAASEEQYAKHAPSMRFRSIVDSALGSLTRLRRPASPESKPVESVVVGPPPLILEEVPKVSTLAETSSGPKIECRSAEAELLVNVVAEPQPEPSLELELAPAPIVPGVSAGRIEPPAQAVTVPAPPSAVVEPVLAVSQPEAVKMFETVAQLCTEFGRVVERSAVRDLLHESAAVLNAAGLIVWLADESGECLRPGLVHGYSEKVLAHLPAVTRDADHATAAAFRTGKPCEVAATDRTSGALVVPLLTPDGCGGVLAVELQQGVKASAALRVGAALLAAAMTQLIHRSRPVERAAPVERPAPAPAVAQFRPAARPMKVRR